MPISPANNLNIKTLRTSQLTSISSPLASTDLVQISQYQGGVYYSRKSTLADFSTYLGSISSHYTGSFQIEKSKFLSGITGSLTTSATAGTFGDNNFLPIKINGTMYKIPLYPNS